MADEWEDTYRLLVEEVFEHLNPSDEDIAEVAIAINAVKFAAEFIESIPCTCPPNAGSPDWEVDPCRRCQAIGRARDVRIEP